MLHLAVLCLGYDCDTSLALVHQNQAYQGQYACYCLVLIDLDWRKPHVIAFGKLLWAKSSPNSSCALPLLSNPATSSELIFADTHPSGLMLCRVWFWFWRWLIWVCRRSLVAKPDCVAICGNTLTWLGAVTTAIGIIGNHAVCTSRKDVRHPQRNSLFPPLVYLSPLFHTQQNYYLLWALSVTLLKP